MNIDDFVRNQIKKTHDRMFGDLLRSNKSFDVRYISAYLLFSQRIKGQIGDHDGVSVNDIKSIFVSCLNECELEYDNPTKKRDKYAEYHFFRMVIFYTHAEKFLELQQYNEAIQALMDAKECLGASKIFKHADLVHIVDSDHKYTVASEGGIAKAKKEAERKAPIYQKLEQIWDSGKWDWRGKKKGYENFANWAIHSEENDGLGHEAIRKHISKYHKSKNTD